MSASPGGDCPTRATRERPGRCVLLVHPHRVVGAENGDRATQRICFVSAPAAASTVLGDDTGIVVVVVFAHSEVVESHVVVRKDDLEEVRKWLRCRAE